MEHKLIIMEGTHVMEKDAIGETVGFSVHASGTRKALEQVGVKFAKEKEGADLVFHQVPAHLVKRIDGLPNVLYTAYESLDLPKEYSEPAGRMDAIIGVSEFVSRAFRRAFPDKFIKTCSLGVDTKLFSYKKRRYSEPFIYLWIGQPSMRKGWNLLREAWYHFSGRKDCVLIVKTTGRGKLERAQNVIVDSRKIGMEEMVNLYHLAHCFISTSYSEGFCLPLAEAMATGLPCIYVPWGGVTDFANRKTAFPVKYNEVGVRYGTDTIGAEADVNDLVNTMQEIKNNYRRALVKGKEVSRYVNQNLTWQHTGRKMIFILQEFLKNYNHN